MRNESLSEIKKWKEMSQQITCRRKNGIKIEIQ